MSVGHVPESIRQRVRAWAHDRCSYCLSSQHLVYATLEIEHIIPRAGGGESNEGNLCLACRLCNSFKGAQVRAVDPLTGNVVPLFNPRRDSWPRHFRWSRDGSRILGRSARGRATVNALQLNNPVAMTVRRAWISAGWHPPDDEI